MTINYDEILDLIEAKDQACEQYSRVNRALKKVAGEAREAHDPQPGEAWRVIIPWGNDVREVIPAIKTATGWVTDPGYFGGHDIDSGHRLESAVIPLGRLAEAPTADDKEEQ
ncbi:hypothetical protein [Corynebacterium urealyticum]|uniref:hypothetical protein n=1 Tax=Corynebacterium urealyticum TaxID=43771 RepID=UPI00293E0F6E|nr:hypothetical protein [Corynebacterium urealyticum]WOH94960.1 hypothetical protein RZ943_02905 [Corynebacterium urealyticum]